MNEDGIKKYLKNSYPQAIVVNYRKLCITFQYIQELSTEKVGFGVFSYTFNDYPQENKKQKIFEKSFEKSYISV